MGRHPCEPGASSRRRVYRGMALRYPRCPRCGTRAESRPADVVGMTYVEHSHGACPVYRYAVEFHEDGTHDAHVLPSTRTFEDWYADDAA